MNERSLVIILAGGVGKRLWPLSRSNFPKQFLQLNSGSLSFFQQTIQRCLYDKSDKVDLCIVGNYDHRFLIMEQLRQIGSPSCIILLEKEPRNTFFSCVFGALFAKDHLYVNVAFVPSDHVADMQMNPVNLFSLAAENLCNNRIVLFGVKPTFASSQYGYISENEESIDKNTIFIEKPDQELARRYFLSGKYFWNTGIFISKVEVFFKELEKVDGLFLSLAQSIYLKKELEFECTTVNTSSIHEDRAVSVDYGFLEKSKILSFIPIDWQWSDIGSLPRLHQFLKDSQSEEGDNIVIDQSAAGYEISKNVSSSFIVNRTKQKVFISGFDNMFAIVDNDLIFLSNLKNSTADYDINLPTESGLLVGVKEYRPWGFYETVLQESGFKIKKITILPQRQLSFQFHSKRSEHWVILSGVAQVRIEDEVFTLKEHSSIYIPIGKKHRIKNISNDQNLVFIELQTGLSFDEQDIVRMEDDFGRV